MNIIRPSDLLFNEYSIPDSDKSEIRKFIRKWATSNLKEPTLDKFINTPQSLLKDLKGQPFGKSKSKIGEYLVNEDINQILAGQIRLIRVPYKRNLVSVKAKYLYTMINPDTNSKVDHIHVWQNIESGKIYTIPFGDTKVSDNPKYMLPQYKKCIDRGVPLVDVTGLFTDPDKIRRLKKTERDRLERLNKQAIMRSTSRENELLLRANITAHDLYVTTIGILRVWLYHHQHFDFQDSHTKDGKIQFKSVYHDMMKFGVSTKTKVSWDRNTRRISQNQEVYRGKPKIVANRNKENKKLDLGIDNRIRPKKTRPQDSYSHTTSPKAIVNEADEKYNRNRKPSETQEPRIIMEDVPVIDPGPDIRPGAEELFDIFRHNPEAFEMFLKLIGKGGEFVADVVGKSLGSAYGKFREHRQNISPNDFDSSVNTSKKAVHEGIGQGVGKSPHERQPHRVTLTHPRYKNKQGQTIERKGSNVNKNKDK